MFFPFPICNAIFRYVLKPEHVKRFFGYVQVPEFDVAADATSTFEVVFFALVTIMAACFSLSNFIYLFIYFFVIVTGAFDKA